MGHLKKEVAGPLPVPCPLPRRFQHSVQVNVDQRSCWPSSQNGLLHIIWGPQRLHSATAKTSCHPVLFYYAGNKLGMLIPLEARRFF